jgi:D-tyrosyl-tRNA(Tyr) deacylase
MSEVQILSPRPDVRAATFMRAVLQRVDRSRIVVAGKEISATGKGLLVLLGVEKGDSEKEADSLLEKIIHLRIFEDDEGKMNRSLLETGGDLQIVSQFTLMADSSKGRRPSFAAAAEPQEARRLCDYFIGRASEKVGRVGQGEFQAMMKVELVNDGPVTLCLECRKDR